MKDTRMKHYLTIGFNHVGVMVIGHGKTAAEANSDFNDSDGVHTRMNLEFFYDPEQRSTAQAVQLELGL